jgi:hypothetical protein
MKDGDHVYSETSEREHKMIVDYLPLYPKVIMDIGGGLGRVAIRLNAFYNLASINYIVADRTGFPTKNTGDYNPEEDQYYNDLELTASFCMLNGIKTMETFDTEKDDWSKLPPVDLIISQFSFGFHVSLDRYMERMYACLAPGGTMMFGIGWHKSYDEHSFKHLFNKITYLPQIKEHPFPCEDWLILQEPKNEQTI